MKLLSLAVILGFIVAQVAPVETTAQQTSAAPASPPSEPASEPVGEQAAPNPAESAPTDTVSTETAPADKPATEAAPAGPPPAPASMDIALQQVNRWLRVNSRFGPDATMVNDVNNLLATDLGLYNFLSLSFGTGLMRSEGATEIALFAGQAFFFELTPEQVAKVELGEFTNSYGQFIETLDLYRQPLPATLSHLQLSTGKTISGAQSINGTVRCKVDAPLPGEYALRLSYVRDRSPHSLFKWFKAPPAADTPIEFSFDCINDFDEEDPPYGGPTPLFFSLCNAREVNNDEGPVEVVLLSKPIAILVDVTPEKATAPADEPKRPNAEAAPQATGAPSADAAPSQPAPAPE